ncbi:hypothetical protein G9A89_013545 [Geosiphon pyriformis]|nr:hypothetical protein G9A89_013545 [Geosiphon pyriformis]
MDLETASSDIMSKKKTLKDAFYGLADGFFSQKKKVVLGNIKHSDNEKNISLKKSELGNNVFSDVNSLSGNNKSANITGINIGSLLGLAFNTFKTKWFNTGANFGSPLSSSNFDIDDNEITLSFHVNFSLEKKWIDPKITKVPVKIPVRKSFALDINLSAVKKNLVTAKTQLIRKMFLTINSFGGATTPSKFEEIIRSTFTFEKNMIKVTSLTRKKRIDVNNNLKRQGMRSDQTVIIKEIPMNTSKDMIIATVSKFGEIKSIKIQLIGMWQKAVVEFAELGQTDLLASK